MTDNVALRLLEEAADDEVEQTSESQVLRDTFIVYGSIFVVLFLLFCWIRQRFRRPYTLRQWVDDIKTYLADDQFGFFSWVYKVFFFTEDELMNECGMDSLCFLRVVRCGFKISLLGIFNAIWLMPIYSTANDSEETSSITEGVTEVTISHVPSGSNRLIATTLAAYVIFGYTMYLILHEFTWFTEMRNKFLVKPFPRNYAVYVRNIPDQYSNKSALERFFRRIFSPEAVLEVNFRVKAAQLAKFVSNRDSVVTKLEHAVAVEDATGKAPTHTNSLIGGQKVNSIEAYAEELKELNLEVTERIDKIEASMNDASSVEHESIALLSGDAGESILTTNEVAGDIEEASSRSEASSTEDEYLNAVAKGLNSFKASAAAAKNVASSAVAATSNVAASAAAIVLGEEDGALYNAAFVSFSNLSSVQEAQQVIHCATPFTMEVFEAPEPEDVLWANVGRQHKDLQLGKLASISLTTALCLLWTIPMTFFASLSSVEGLKEQFGWLEDAIEMFPFLEPLLEQLAPLLVVVVNALLPTILEFITLFEGPVSGAVVESSLFTKLAAFMIIQTFFVSALSGGILQEISNILADPSSIIDLLATSLPEQSTYFMQILIVGTVIMVGVELLRVVPIAMALIRSCVGPRLTEKERRTTFMGLRPLADPKEFEHADVLSTVVLYFMVLLVYAVIAPLVAFVSAFCFLYMSAAYRHQFCFIYPPRPDSGGKLWLNFIRILLVCMVIAEITIVGLLALKKAGIATILMVPLIIIQILFNCYLGQEHFRAPSYLPSMDSIIADDKNADMSFSFLKNAYVQPELQTKEVLPDGLSKAQEMALGFASSGSMTQSYDTENDNIVYPISTSEGEGLITPENEDTGTSTQIDPDAFLREVAFVN